jgi:hypothetical protein
VGDATTEYDQRRADEYDPTSGYTFTIDKCSFKSKVCSKKSAVTRS